MSLQWARSAAALAALGAISLVGCDSTVRGGETSGGGGAVDGPGGSGGGAPSLPAADKVDLLLVLDNSGSMRDKQEVLSLALADLVQGITNPPCLDGSGRLVLQPASGDEVCPDGSTRARTPVQDMHVGIISSSLGGHGARTCLPEEGPTNNDRGRLLSRTDPNGSGVVPTYQDKGFLAWDPAGRHSPPGDSEQAALVGKFRDMVLGVGQVGCGFEAPLESWYRFLADPEPYDSIAVVDSQATPQGVDVALLQQRAAFLRPDSLLVILMLTDENDCSMIDGGMNYLAAERRTPGGAPFQLWQPRSECAVDPNDPCCKSCQQDPGECPPDPACFNPDGTVKTLSALEDPVNLRCYDQKRRFGVDFLYPIERYQEALTSPTLTTRSGEIVPNPIFSDLDPTDGITRVRDPGLVVMTGIVGVPWQDLARDPGNLAAGLKSAAQLAAPLPSGATTWDVILGDPATYVPPQDPLMVESVAPRAGMNPITGDPVAPPGSLTNPINGSEWTIPAQNDLQYACTFPLLSPRQCGAEAPCDCEDPSNDSPLCAPGPDGSGNTLQVNAKAYPGRRELDLLKRLGDQGVTASICPAQLHDTARPDYGYRPIVRALLDRMSQRL